MIRVLIVDDMKTIRLALRSILESDPELTIVGEAGNGEEGLALCRKFRPDIVTMDINMPGMSGYEAIQHIMNEVPCPIVVITGIESKPLVEVSFKALTLGALTVLAKPSDFSPENAEAKSLINQIKTMAAVKVVRRSLGTKPAPASIEKGESQLSVSAQLVAIGLSTGGPPALQTVLSGLPLSFPLPILVVQHISHGFVSGLSSWLSKTTQFRCKVGAHDETIQPGTVYLAPDNIHLTVRANGKLWLDGSEPLGGHRPSATVLFESVAKNFGAKAIGILMTGMGQDGAWGLKALHQAGAHTIVQDEASSVISSMPKAAIALNAADEILDLSQIAPRLISLTKKNRLAEGGPFGR